MVETAIVIVIVGAAIVVVGRMLYRSATGKGGCSCGESCTPSEAESCAAAPNKTSSDQK